MPSAPSSQRLGSFEYLFDGDGELAPCVGFAIELLAAHAGEFVILGTAIVVRGAPFRPDPAAALETMQRRVQRPLLDAQNFTGDLLYSLGNSPAVLRPGEQRAQKDEIESALREFDAAGQ